MIMIKPYVEITITCPECGAGVSCHRDDVHITGMQMLASCTCPSCHLAFDSVLPVGHFVDASLAFRKVDKHLYAHQEDAWLLDVAKELYQEVPDVINIQKEVYRECRDVVILNTLDYLYGHTLLKLYNAQYHLDHQPHLGLIVIVPRLFQWMIPAGCAEAWIVDLPLNKFRQGYSHIASFVYHELERFDTIYISRAYSHPDSATIDINRFTGIPPFNLNDFYTMPPHITFVVREDRWWFASVVDYWVYRIGRRLHRPLTAARWLCNRQNGLIKKTIRMIRHQFPLVECSVVGVGKTGDFKNYAEDRRVKTMDVSVERAWCSLYSRSHIVIGIHGSNLLLPTALAAGCIEVLPSDRNGNLVQDITVRYTDRRQLFFYRFVNQYAHPTEVAQKAISILLDYRKFNLNMCRNIYTTPVTEINTVR